jgi:ATP-dependent RNA helicase DOB1
MDAAIADAIADSGNSKKRGRQQRGKRSAGPEAGLYKIVKLIMDRNLNPVIVFSFSKKACEKFALALNSEDYTDDVEKDLISQVYINAIDSLSEDDQKLPQVEALLPLLKRGIGIHHSGLLPILKEIVEILFAEGLIKALFATETFAIGINMPAKTVVFTNTRKWDGKDFRWVSSGEYIQMSGRAGRRGKDDRGIVIQMVDEKMDPDVCKDILYGIPDPLNSSYRISYNMLLNLMRVEDVDPEYLLRASFFQYQREIEAPALINQAEEREAEANSIDTGSQEEAEMVSEFYQMEQQLVLTRRRIKQSIRKPSNILKFLQVGGRLLEISIEGENFGWGALVSCKKKQGTGAGGSAGRMAAMTAGPDYNVDVLLPCMDRHFDDQSKRGKEEDSEDNKLIWRGNYQTCRPARKEDKSSLVSFRIFTVGLENIENISAARIFIPQDCTTVESRRTVQSTLKEVKNRFKDGVPLLDPVKDMGIEDESFLTLLDRASTLADRMSKHKLTSELTEEKRSELVTAFEKKEDLKNQARLLREKARSFQTIALKDDMRKMKRVLKRLGHVDANGVIQTKGRTACEINTAHELVVVELIFGGIFNELSVEQCVSLLSAMTFSEKNSDDDDPASKLQSFLSRPFYKLQEVARTVARIEAACGVDVKEEEFVDSFNPGMYVVLLCCLDILRLLAVEDYKFSAEDSCMLEPRHLQCWSSQARRSRPDDPLKINKRPYSLSTAFQNVIGIFMVLYFVSHTLFSLYFRMEAVYAWCKGAKFVQVQQLTAAYEGTTIRTLRRLEELIRQITVAAKAIGNTELEAKFEKGSELIKRDIVFCSSLYL